MPFQSDPDRIVWRMHLDSPPSVVFDALDSAEGRASFWAESAVERAGVVEFRFINDERYDGEILERDRAQRWSVDYFRAPVVFELFGDEGNGTDVVMSHDIGADHPARCEVTAGWLNVLLPMKAAIDHGVDLHNHHRSRCWDHGFVDH